jgi:hypothetical protein
MGNNYDYDVLGTGNPDHPANREEASEFQSEDLKECLDHFYETGDSEPLAEAIHETYNSLASVHSDLVECINFARSSDNAFLANKLATIRTKIDQYGNKNP